MHDASTCGAVSEAAPTPLAGGALEFAWALVERLLVLKRNTCACISLRVRFSVLADGMLASDGAGAAETNPNKASMNTPMKERGMAPLLCLSVRGGRVRPRCG
uniref:Uncharacterized protein n=1 Tax=Alexandrium catenella TaxID=2925 RepID=A0A7S1LZY5_ALECA